MPWSYENVILVDCQGPFQADASSGAFEFSGAEVFEHIFAAAERERHDADGGRLWEYTGITGI